HHHAHLAACLAENHYPDPAIGVILDGTGYGPDGTIWGGEVLVGDFSEFTRYAFLEPMPLPGGDVSIREPWRTAVGYLTTLFGADLPNLAFLDNHNWQPIAEIAQNRQYSPLTSSCGRLFDAVSAMAGGRQAITYEAQAAIELMNIADRTTNHSYEINLQKIKEGYMMMITPLLHQIVSDIQHGASLASISASFHQTLINLLTQTVLLASEQTNIKTVALSGGVFTNRLLHDGLRDRLTARGLTVLSHSLTPPGDGCIALGQAIIGRHHSDS
ncbi:MAG: hydrogenase maturation protein HypF, partial [Desulfobulbaceae bacterium]|nr:hydrogenase maturation protein HypF [Desulfobulbaceae bacterium]